MEEINESLNIDECLLLEKGDLKKNNSGIHEHNTNEISQIQENVLCNNICMKFQNAQDNSVVIGVRTMVTWRLEGRELGNGRAEV